MDSSVNPNLDFSVLQHIHVVLVATTHPGNIGATARAMKNMGLSKLRLVQPKIYPSEEANRRASGATDILETTQVFDDFATAIQDCGLVLGSSARLRSIAWPLLTPREAAEQTFHSPTTVALVFGREHAGLTNEELDMCHALLHIPCNPAYSSLNVAAAVQVVTYELFQTFLAHNAQRKPLASTPVSNEDMQRFYVHLEQTLADINFLQVDKPNKLMRKLRKLFNRAQPTQSEMNILRGILSAAQQVRHIDEKE